ncbi:hypothetical protein S1OALGB6SA_2089 [Olavius algarvensis spirochete endosymbiont]|nr:hypothetical protein [Olavius algarvensis spirochete endosymbiont]VDB00995.1 hypothetical protein S1OALGB6SA_2089 [Olavius algarvensis spirochete endosymbiont]
MNKIGIATTALTSMGIEILPLRFSESIEFFESHNQLKLLVHNRDG